ncbi:hypothetical protein ALC60_04819 [Trachymyrmex zeteki]|uniref:Uncharacterized protein n=1 Tax=Mycetomoellerius zeteki TaxID=64791 RepID=A0A151X758_9HYME|nr:hypothetical protein ALC60_04819 [Trachymyrmex zeteki]
MFRELGEKHNWEEDNPEHVSLSSEKVLEDYYSRSIIQFRVKRNDRGSRKPEHRALHIHFLESHFLHYSPEQFPSQIIIRPRELPVNARVAMEKHPYSTNGTRSQSVFTIHIRTGHSEAFLFLEGRTPGSRNVRRPNDRRIDETTDRGRNDLDVRYVPVCREYAPDAPKGGRREKERQRERKRKREKRQRTREGSAREFAGRLKHGSAVSRPRTRNSTRLRRTSPPSPSALPRGQGVTRGCRGWDEASAARLRQVNPARRDGGIRCTWYRYLPLGTLPFYGAYPKRDTNERTDIETTSIN